MSLEQQVIALTEATEQLLEAVNTRKADLDTAETNASLSAQIAASAASTANARATAAESAAVDAAQAAQAAQAAVDALVASPTVERIEVVTAAQYAALTPVASTLYVIEG